MSSRILPGVVGVAVGVLLVVASLASSFPDMGLLTHTECRLGSRVGNVTAWMPAAIVAAPHLGSETGKVEIWGRSPAGNGTLSQATTVRDGNVTAFYVIYSNLTIFSLSSVSVGGPGVHQTCTTGFVAYFSSQPAQGLNSGGTALWSVNSSGLVSDDGLPHSFNSSELCLQVENSTDPSCAVSTQFDVNYHAETGEVDTCGSNQAQILRARSTAWPVEVPFNWAGTNYTVPVSPGGTDSASYANGTVAWYNYTFPAYGGIWDYDNLSRTSSTGAGLVFSYAPCP